MNTPHNGEDLPPKTPDEIPPRSFRHLPKEPRTPMERPNNGMTTHFYVVLFTVLGLILVIGVLWVLYDFITSQDLSSAN